MKNCKKSISEDAIPSHKSHFVYMLFCADSSLYTGYTTELLRRIRMHNEGRGAKYTRGRGPVELLYWEEGTDRSWGLKREEAIKRLPRPKKEALIAALHDRLNKTDQNSVERIEATVGGRDS